jgi:hypothetical protein
MEGLELMDEYRKLQPEKASEGNRLMDESSEGARAIEWISDASEQPTTNNQTNVGGEQEKFQKHQMPLARKM